MAFTAPNRYVDITEAIDKKVAALRCHRSQAPDRNGDLDMRMREWSSATATHVGLPSGRLAEGFRFVDTR
jgi:LmbE family N-acetylglucosaminyl deacetylase